MNFIKTVKLYNEMAYKYIMSAPTTLSLENNPKQKFRDALEYHLLNERGMKNVPERVLKKIEREIVLKNSIEIDLKDYKIQTIILNNIKDLQDIGS